MIQTGTGNLDFANALLHGRRSRLHEGFRLNETCRLRTITELAYTPLPALEEQSPFPGFNA